MTASMVPAGSAGPLGARYETICGGRSNGSSGVLLRGRVPAEMVGKGGVSTESQPTIKDRFMKLLRRR